MSVLTTLRTITRDEARAELAKPGGRLRFLHDTKPDSNGGFIVDDPREQHHVADVREGWAGGVQEPVCNIGDDFLFDHYLNNAAVWIDRGEWVRVKIEGLSGGPDEAISTR
jgi:hypothetical protein